MNILSVRINIFLLSAFLLMSTLGLIIENYFYYKTLSFFGTTCLIIICFYHLQRLLKYQIDLGIFVFLLGSLFWFFIELFSLSILDKPFVDSSSYSPFGREQIPYGILSVSIFSLSLFCFISYFIWAITQRVKFLNFFIFKKRQLKSKIYIDLFLFFIVLMGWFPFYKEFGGIKNALIKLFLFRDANIELEPSLINFLPIFAIVAASFAFFRLITKMDNNRLISLLIFLIGSAIAFLSGTRFKIIILLVPAILVIFVIENNYQTTIKKIRAIFLIFLMLFAVTFYQIINRNLTNSDNQFTFMTGSGHFIALSHAVSISEDLDEYFYQPMGLLFLSDFIPRMYWKDKIKPLFWDYYNERLAVSQNTNITPSILGQYYLNWGLIGSVIIGINIGLYIRLIDEFVFWYKKNKNLFNLWLAVFVSTFVFLSFRVYSFNYFFYVLISFFFGFLFTKSDFK